MVPSIEEVVARAWSRQKNRFTESPKKQKLEPVPVEHAIVAQKVRRDKSWCMEVQQHGRKEVRASRMKPVADHLALAASLLASNVWMLKDAEGRRFLIDTGLGLERLPFKGDLRRAGIRKPGDLTAILLTHRHCDHAGNAVWLRERLRCPIVCHRHDARVLAGLRPAPRLARGVGTFVEELMCRYEDARAPRLEVDEAISEGPWRYGFRFLPAFGHTEGSVFIYHEPTRTLFTGDAVLTGAPPFRSKEQLGLAVPAFSLDVEACHTRALAVLSSPLPVEHLASGHGPYIGDRVSEKIEAFVQGIREGTKAAVDNVSNRGVVT